MLNGTKGLLDRIEHIASLIKPEADLLYFHPTEVDGQPTDLFMGRVHGARKEIAKIEAEYAEARGLYNAAQHVIADQEKEVAALRARVAELEKWRENAVQGVADYVGCSPERARAEYDLWIDSFRDGTLFEQREFLREDSEMWNKLGENAGEDPSVIRERIQELIRDGDHPAHQAAPPAPTLWGVHTDSSQAGPESTHYQYTSAVARKEHLEKCLGFHHPVIRKVGNS